ncbi:hypothetical protein [Dysgonomonas sp. HGC4]|uniref:hypothetical protein n=1 Tax=Dysgonomonas sp. HGC4 TaxID=1658009 RepID=UPI00068220D1|nr:hypothetical protein [Dysgonomonas sp. HGC4]MBD8349945.1 hypothetical protein [Dysgonomonas sp. HGC4]
MKTMELKMLLYILLCGWSQIITGCSRDDSPVPEEEEAYIFLSIKASSGSINEDAGGEDRITEVRMIAFDPDGNSVYNDILDFPHGFGSRSHGIKFKPGTYDFYFFANESAYVGFHDMLTSVTNVSQFQSDSRFNGLLYNPGFKPDTSTNAGRMLMSAVYKAIRVLQGGTEASPEPLVLPTPKVELVRSLARVEIVFYKKNPGSILPAADIVSSVQLQNVAASYSVPPSNSYYSGQAVSSLFGDLAGLDYTRDSIGSVGPFYIPESLNKSGNSSFTGLHINNRVFPILTDKAKTGLTAQRRTISSLSDSCIIRNYHYRINAYISPDGSITLKTCVEPWKKDDYVYIFQDGQSLAIPPVIPTDSSVIVPTSCGKIEIHSTNEQFQQGLMGAFGDQVNWWDPNVQGPNIIKGQPPYYCEKKYGPGWRLINSCEMMSFLALFDQTYKIWQSNTWLGINSGIPFYSKTLRQQAQDLLGRLTGMDMSKYLLSDMQGGDSFGSEKLGIIDAFFTPGDIVVTRKQFPGGWPYPAPPFQGIEDWYPMEVVHQVKEYWYSGYLDYADPANYDKVLYQRFERYSFSSTVSRCVRNVE